MPEFIPGLELSLKLHQALTPILAKAFPSLAYSAARLDYGSDVLGFDTPRSMDHDWGPRLTLYVDEKDFGLKDAITEKLGMELPLEIEGHSTHFEQFADGALKPAGTQARPIRHAVLVTTAGRFLKEYLGLDRISGFSAKDWLLVPQQRLRAIQSGRVYHDGLKSLEPLRLALAWYPQQLWLYLMACQWQRINQEEPMMARCGHVGDELGSRLIAARLCQEIMRLCFLMERAYAPYSKWFGTAFSKLEAAAEMKPLLEAVLDSGEYLEREARLGAVYLALIRRHNALGLTGPIEEKLSPFWSRPYLVPGSQRLVQALRAAIQSPEIKALPEHLGGVDQFVDSTDVLTRVGRLRKLDGLFREEA